MGAPIDQPESAPIQAVYMREAAALGDVRVCGMELDDAVE